MEAAGYIELTITFVTLIFSGISIVGSLVFRLYYHRKIDLEYLSWGIFLGAVWNIINSQAGQALFHNSQTVADIVFFVMLLLPLPFLFYIDKVQMERYHKFYRIAEVLEGAECVVFFGLYYFYLHDYADIFLPVILCFCLFIALVTCTFLSDIFHGHMREYFAVAAGMVCVWIAVFLRIISYIQRDKVKGDAVLPVGLTIMLLLAAANTIRDLVNIEKKRRQALMASEAKSKFLANMSHEIRTPINAVLGMNAMILRECKDRTIREYALDIQNAGQSLLALINDILDLSKIESGKLELFPEEYDFSSLLHDVINMIAMKAKDKDLAVHLSVDENLPSRFWGDDVRLRQVLVNIMNNAVKYTEKGSVTLTVTGKATKSDHSVSDGISDKGAQTEDAVCSLTFQVKDTGIGIRQEDLVKLFQEFQRIEEERNRNIEGTGLGMSITTQLLELMGSKLQVESVYGEGSTFYFTLEQRVIDAEPIGNLEERIRERATEYSYQAKFTAPKAQILVVDDNSVNRRVFANLLKATEVMIDEAAGGMECLKLAREKQYDVIFLDHMMPDLNGIETLHRLREIENCPCHSTPVIALTANAVSGAREMYLKEGFDSFLSKPIIPDKLEKMLMQFLPEDKITYEKIKNDFPEGTADNGVTQKGQLEESKGLSGLPQLDGIDWEYAMLHLKDESILKDTVNHFYLAMDKEAEELEQFFQLLQKTSGEQQKMAVKQFEIKVHAMKSNSAMIGAMPLSGVAKMLEYAAKDEKIGTIQAVTPAFFNEWKKMKAILESYVEHDRENDGNGKLQADWNEVRQNLHKIVDAMNDMDIDTADESMNQMKKYQYPEQMNPLVNNLSLAVVNIDLVQAENWAGELIKIIDELEETKL